MKEIFQIAIDGPAASGKGTVAKMLARKFGFLCLDTGALYRGVTCYFMDEKVDITSEVEVNKALGKIDLRAKCHNSETLIFLGSTDVSSRLHDIDVCEYVFHVARIPAVRVKVREIQHKTSEGETLICEGRDITHVVFPNARFKFFLTASAKVRAQRRLGLERKNGNEETTLAQVKKMIMARDKADRTRKESPMKKVRGAIKIDCTRLTAAQATEKIERIITRKLNKNS